MILPEAIIKTIESDGILIQQELAGELLFLKYQKGSSAKSYSKFKEGEARRVDFEVNSFFWSKVGKYITNAVLISIT